jgi:RimJ/RimL family protein N-acetyltransferase
MAYGLVTGPILETDRLLLRRWKDADRAPLAAIQADSAAMRYFVAARTREESDALIDESEAGFESDGFGLWALERKADRRFLGFAGLAHSDFDAPFCPAIDAGWHLTRDVWGQGYATEAGRVVFDFAFDALDLAEVVAHTTAVNPPSIAVMQRLGMSHDPVDDFDGPWYPEGHPLRRFVLYRMDAARWRRQRS